MTTKKTATVTTSYDGGGGNKVTVPEHEFIETRTVEDASGKHEEALVEIGGDGGGKITEWARVDESEEP